MDTAIIIAVAVVAAALFVVPYYRKQKRMEEKALKAESQALKYGLHEPASLHPVVDPSRCIGTGNCVEICPEKNVLGLVAGQARPISPARCIGHGLCERICPVDAIQLVFGTEKRGIDIPRIKENFETNVPGIYIVGELGGMGLIRNAFEQGRQCVEGILRESRPNPPDALDVLVVGCGPAGLSTAINCSHHGLRFEIIEKDDVGGAVRTYPRKKVVMTSPLKVPGYGKLSFREIVKEDLVALWAEMIEKSNLNVRTFEPAENVHRREDGLLEVQTSRGTYLTRRVVLAIGRRGVPRRLGIPGEESPNVSYSLREPEEFRGDRITVVGGGDSAVEAALSLSDQPATRVLLSYRKEQFSRIKPGNLQRIEASVADGRVDIKWSTNISRIAPDRIAIRHADGREEEFENDYVFVFAGGILPTKFLESCGIAIDTKFGEPIG
jgi:thioredoxin reductase